MDVRVGEEALALPLTDELAPPLAPRASRLAASKRSFFDDGRWASIVELAPLALRVRFFASATRRAAVSSRRGARGERRTSTASERAERPR